MNPEQKTLEARDLHPTDPVGMTRRPDSAIPLATGEAISPLLEEAERKAGLMNVLTATILVLRETSKVDPKQINNVMREAGQGNDQSIADFYHGQTPEVRSRIDQMFEHVRAVNRYVAFGAIKGYWGGIGDIFTPENRMIEEVRIGLLLNGDMPDPKLVPQGRDLAQMVKEVEKRALTREEEEDIHDLELELAHRVPRLQELGREPRKNYLQSLFERSLVVEGRHPDLAHGVVIEDGEVRVIPVKACVTKLKRPNGGKRLVTLLKPVDEKGNLISLE